MITEIGHFALVLALALAVVQTVVPLIGSLRGDERMMRMADPSAIVQFGLVLVAFLALMQAYVTSDFSVANVYQNSHSAKPLLYKISGVWGNHEGSMVLWVLILNLFASAVAMFGGNLPLQLRAKVLAVQSSIALAFLIFVVTTSNPFVRLDPAPIEGLGLNPILQDPALAFHPPFLYAGYVGFSMAFSFAIAALIDGRIDAAWARWVRPWTLVAWMCLTLGIAMGSWWAYYELGWGGWWFWDPVENASFMPWLAGTALLHSALVMEKRDALKVWTVLLAIMAFSLSLLGAFLVRSGVLTSVHAFAVDPERGVFILAIMAVFIGGSFALFAWRAQRLRDGGMFQLISREGSLVLNNILLIVSCGAVLFGTLYPLLLEALTGEKISVGPPFFNMLFGLFVTPLLLAVPFGPSLAWKRGDVLASAERLFAAAGLALLATVATAAVMWRGPWLAPFGIGLAIWLIVGALSDIAFRSKLFSASREEGLRRLVNLPRAAFGTMLGHLGVGVTLFGIVATSAWQAEQIVALRPGDKVDIAGYQIVFRGLAPRQGPNYVERIAALDVLVGGVKRLELTPSKRNFPAERQTTTEAGIYASMLGDLYTVLGDEQPDGSHAFRIYYNPLVRLIWFGAVVMFLGGTLSLSDRRLRVGAPRQSRRPAMVAAE